MKFSAFTTLLLLNVVKASHGPIENVVSRMSDEFLEGFDQGMAIRDSPDQFDEFGCP